MYFLNAPDFQRPMPCISKSENPLSAAAVAPPILKEWPLYFFVEKPELPRYFFNSKLKKDTVIGKPSTKMNKGPCFELLIDRYFDINVTGQIALPCLRNSNVTGLPEELCLKCRNTFIKIRLLFCQETSHNCNTFDDKFPPFYRKFANSQQCKECKRKHRLHLNFHVMRIGQNKYHSVHRFQH